MEQNLGEVEPGRDGEWEIVKQVRETEGKESDEREEREKGGGERENFGWYRRGEEERNMHVSKFYSS
eukprot:1348563-Amorphochlora_amoeboformis.AAC.1